ncbi:general secretion pathway protein F [Bordetella ansorpii]|uniref:General secretion pathway protein F n=1 Tax=Bordetella ansorpii TaxID=288768 RepID=A0A157SR91_9BORD|nr:type II secretion system inner membrane protein GspF [Bordetella ansorpii]SAI72980.1 general secretion pathway protein F [Bordetella ansorpii]
MAHFRYRAADGAGKIVRGQLDADSPRSARAQLRGRGLAVLEVAEAQGSAGAAGASLFAPKLKDSELAWATRQLSSLLTGRLPLEEALTGVVEQAEKKHIAESLSAVRADVRGGMRLADAMARRPRDYPEVYRALVAAGESSGDLAQVMRRLADYIESRDVLRAKVLTAFIYPAVVAVISVCIVIFLLTYVVPQVIGAFSQAKRDLPMLTQVMLMASDFVRNWGWLTALTLAAGFGYWRWRLRDSAVRLAWDSRLLHLPLMGRFILEVNTARFASTLAILTDAGVPLMRALEAARQTLGNQRLRACVLEAAGQVEGGTSLGAALKAQKYFPSLLCRLVASGEKTGELPLMLDQAADTLSKNLERRAMAMTALLEPLMTVIMGGLVLTIVLAVMLPIMEMNQLVL